MKYTEIFSSINFFTMFTFLNVRLLSTQSSGPVVINTDGDCSTVTQRLRERGKIIL